jgi:hypothetical protein
MSKKQDPLKNALQGGLQGFASTGSPYGALAGAGMSLAGSLFSGDDDEEQKAEEAQRAALAQYQNIAIPDIADQQLHLEGLKSVGDYTPEMEAAMAGGSSAMEGVSSDPRLKEQNMRVLSQMTDAGRGGLTMEDRAALNELRNKTAQQTQARDASILQNMAQRGVAGSGSELAARMIESQNAGNEASAAGDRLASMGQQKALQALASAGSMGGQMQTQDFREKSDVANAADIARRFDVTNSRDVQQRNVGSRNTAQAGNLANNQRVADTNVGLRNTEQEHNKGLIQQHFTNEMTKANGMSGQYKNIAEQANNQQKANDTQAGGIMNAGITAGAAVATNMAKQTPATATASADDNDPTKKKKLDYTNADGLGGGISYKAY